jgi:subtilisin family serine protease
MWPRSRQLSREPLSRRLPHLLAFILSLALSSPQLNAADVASTDDSGAQPVIVQFRTPPGLADRSASGDAARNGERSRLRMDVARLGETAKTPRMDVRRVFNGVATVASSRVVKELRKLPYVRAVYPDVTVRAVLYQSVPLIGADQVWAEFGVTGAGVRIAIIDTGIDWSHPDLGGCFGAGCRVVGGYDFVNHDADPRDDHGHGTHVAGIVAAQGSRVKGVAPDAQLLAYKVLDADGNGYASTIIAGMEAALDPDGNPATDDRADVINLSLGGGGDPDDPMSQAADALAAAGVVVVAAAGNYGPGDGSVQSPGTSRTALTVGATDKQDRPASFSSRGPVTWPGGSIFKPDLTGPGVAICSTRWATAWPGSQCLDDSHVALSGTSMAAPHVAGVAALLLQKHPAWTPAEVKLALRGTAVRLPQPSNVAGFGRVSAIAAVRLDHAPPIAAIATSGAATTDLDIVGTAAGSAFASYALSIGSGVDPTTWTPLASSTRPVTNGVLAADVDAAGRPDGTYTLRLVVADTNGLVSEDRAYLNVDNARITAPRGTDSFAAGAVIAVRGTVVGGPRFSSYAIQYGVGRAPTEWRTTGVTLVNGGSQPVSSGLLGRWNTAGLPAPGIYTLRVVATYAWGSTVEVVNALYLDPRLKPGWPVRIPYDVLPGFLNLPSYGYSMFPSRADARPTADEDTVPKVTVTSSSFHLAAQPAVYAWGGMLVPVVSDLDRDGASEIVVVHYGNPADLRVYSTGGTLKWSVETGAPDTNSGFSGMPAVADLDGDGRREVVIDSLDWPAKVSRLFAFRSDGTLMPGFPTVTAPNYGSSVAIADVDADGFRDVVVVARGGSPRKVTVVGHTGAVLSSWDLPRLTLAASIEPTPALGNFDEDPELEIVVAEASDSGGSDNAGVIHVYNLGGSEVPGWPRYTRSITISSPSVADVDGDGREDIIVAHNYFTSRDESLGGVYVYDRQGRTLSGWPRLLGEVFWSTPAVGDLDRDGRVEIVIGDLSNRIWVFRHDGQTFAGWPQRMVWNNYHSTAIADIDGDRSPDVIATAGNGYVGGGVYAWSSGGRPLPGFPLYTDADAQAGPTIADVDGDGKVEIIASSDWDTDQTGGGEKHRGSLYVWDLDGAYRAADAPWPHFHHDSSHAGRYVGTTAPGASYRLSPTSLAFGKQALGQVSATQSIRLANEGAVALSIVSIALRGVDAAQFTRSTGCGTSVAPGATCTVEVTFRPTTAGAKTATIVVSTGGNAATKSVALSGTGVRAAFAVTPVSLSFGTVTVNTTSSAKAVTVSNTGTVAVPSLAFKLAGTNPGQFTRTTNCPAQLAVGSSCTVSLKFKPTSRGAKTATLQVSAAGGAAMKLVALAGTGR